jgi:hypothetical protein
MATRISLTHLVFLLVVCAAAIFLNWSAVSASDKLYNLIVVVPSGIACVLLVLCIAISNLRKPATKTSATPSEAQAARKSTLGDLLLLGAFAVFCLSLTTVGFDVATFVFVWVGILMGGEKNKIAPPIFAFLFTLALIKGFGSLFPFPMPLLVF